MKKVTIYMSVMFILMIGTSSFAKNVTLNKTGLFSLDYYSESLLTPLVTEKRETAAGVEFDIYFPSNTGLDSQLIYSSSIYGGSAALVPIDVSSYGFYQLDFSYEAVWSQSGPLIPDGLELWVSPFVNDGSNLKYFTSEFIALNDSLTASMDISQLASAGDNIGELGFEVHMDYPDNWPSDGAYVTLQVSPTFNALAIPEPATIIFMIAAIRFVSAKMIRK